MKNDHDPSPFIDEGCVESVHTFDRWKTMAEAICIFTTIASVIAIAISFAICQVSRRGTPTDTDARRLLVPLCKFNMLPVLLMKLSILVLVSIIFYGTNRYCSCVQDTVGRDKLEVEGRRSCPSAREWFYLVRVFVRHI